MSWVRLFTVPVLVSARVGYLGLVFTLKLYVTGETLASRTAIRNLHEICETYLDEGRYTIEVINVIDHPQLAENEKIVATPTLIRELPHPMQRIIGDLSDRDRVLLGLDIA